jgi:hypothetical protein
VSQSFEGPLAEASLERMSPDRRVPGRRCRDAKDGICKADHARTRLNELGPATKMLRRGPQCIGRPPCGRYRKRMTDEDPWYAQLRSQWKPSRVKLLMIAESAPADGGDVSARRFFYADRLGPDNLFRGVVEAMYGASKIDLERTGKRPWLQRLRNEGFFLIDLAQYPVNALSAAERRRVLHEAVPGCVARASALDPAGVAVVKADLYGILNQPLASAGLPLLHDRPIAFPLGNTRADFVAALKQARQRLPT